MPRQIPLSLLLLLSCLCAAEAASPFQPPRVNSIQNRRIMDMAEDSEGYLWFGTDKGLYRYNGSVYKTFFAGTDGSSLTSDFVLSLCADTNDRLWVGTDGGINLIRKGKVERPSPNEMNYVFHLINYSDSTLLYASQDAFFLYNKETGLSRQVIQHPDVGHSTEFCLADDYLWIASATHRNHILVYDDAFEEVRSISFPEQVRVSAICPFKGNIYVAAGNGLHRYQKDGNPLPLPEALNGMKNARVLFCQEDPFRNRMLLGVFNTGVFSYDGKTEKLVRILPNEQLSSQGNAHYKINITREAIWITPWTQNPKQYYEDAESRSTYIQGIGFGEVLNGLYPALEKGKAWAVTSGGIYLFDPYSRQSRKMQFNSHGGNAQIQFSYMDRTGDLYILDSTRELYHLKELPDGSLHTVQSFQADIPGAFLWKDYEGHLCAIHDKTLYVIGEDGSVRSSPMDSPVSGIPHQGLDGRLYFVGREGVFYLDSGHRFVRIHLDIPLPSCCFLAPNGDLFIGSAQDGLFLYKPSDKSLLRIGLEEGLPDLTIRSLVGDSNGDLWISTRNYIAKRSARDGHISVFDYSINIPKVYSARCALRLDDEWRGEKILLGGTQFISIIDPFLNGQSRTIPLSLDAVFVNNMPAPTPDEGLLLHHDENQILFYYSGLDFSQGSQLNYSYRLDGYDKVWVTAGQSLSASYSRLKPGRYTFRARVYSTDGGLSPEEIAFPIRILPTPWLSWPAILGYCLLGLLILAVFLRQFLIIRRGRAEARQAALDRMLAEKETQDKMDAFNSISHDFLAPLSLVYGPAKDLEKGSTLQDKDRKLVSLIVQNADKMMRLTDRLMDFSRMDEPDDNQHIDEQGLSRIALQDETFRNLVEEKKESLNRKDREFLDRLKQIVEDNLSDEEFSATLLAERLGISYTKFYYKVKDLLDTTPQDYLISCRLNRAMELLKTHEYNVSEVSYKVGFSSLAGFSRSFKNRFGIPPSSV